MRSDSPPPSWYEPRDILDDVEHEDLAEPEALVIAADGVVSWCSFLTDDD